MSNKWRSVKKRQKRSVKFKRYKSATAEVAEIAMLQPEVAEEEEPQSDSTLETVPVDDAAEIISVSEAAPIDDGLGEDIPNDDESE